MPSSKDKYVVIIPFATFFVGFAIILIIAYVLSAHAPQPPGFTENYTKILNYISARIKYSAFEETILIDSFIILIVVTVIVSIFVASYLAKHDKTT